MRHYGTLPDQSTTHEGCARTQPAVTLALVSVAGVILAAGAGSRFNQLRPGADPGSKLLTLLNGRPLLAWAVQPALEAGLDEVIVVSGAADLGSVVLEGVTLLHNSGWAGGQATSLQLALAHCKQRGHAAAVVGLGDMPGLTTAAWRAIAGAPGGPIVFATYNGRRGHPVRLDSEVWPLLPTAGDEGARSVARERPDLVSELACLGQPIDIDTPEDVEKWS